jgi:hypothetical protein
MLVVLAQELVWVWEALVAMGAVAADQMLRAGVAVLCRM